MNCSEANDEEVLPRFNIPGRYMTKCVYMTDLMDQMVKDYSIQNNVSQTNSRRYRHYRQYLLCDFYSANSADILGC